MQQFNEYELALANGETHYRPHFPCQRGHYKRYTKSKQCQPCHTLAVARARENGQHLASQPGPVSNPKTHILVDKPCKKCSGHVRYKKRPDMCVPCQQKRAYAWLHPKNVAAEPLDSPQNNDKEYFLTKTATYRKNNSTITDWFYWNSQISAKSLYSNGLYLEKSLTKWKDSPIITYNS